MIFMSDSALDPRAREVLDFWFGEPGSAEYGKARGVWFRKDPDFDAGIRCRFGPLHDDAAARLLDDWRRRADACLALIVVLDQFSRNMHRDTPAAFACDPYALELANHAVAAGFDLQLLPVQRMFVYLPFEHSERLDDQKRSVQLFDTLRDDAELAGSVPYAQKHYDVIERFGRFPHRNAILGRPSTAEELAYLAQPGAGF